MIINFIVTIPKYRGTMDTNCFQLFFSFPFVFLAGVATRVFLAGLCLSLLPANASLLRCA